MSNTITINSNAAIAGLGNIFIFAVLGAIVYMILQFIGKALAFNKMGEHPAKVFVPFYSDGILYRNSGKPLPWFGVMLAISCLISIFSNYLQNNQNNLFAVVILILALGFGVIRIIFLYKIAKSFGMHGAGTVLAFFLEPVFWLVVGCCRSYQYYGVEEKINLTDDLSTLKNSENNKEEQ